MSTEHAKHTPGPWKVADRDGQQWNSPSSPMREVHAIAAHDTVYKLAEVTYPTSSQGYVGADERLANARLIAAAARRRITYKELTA